LQTLSYDKFMDSMLSKDCKTFKLIDDTGHAWNCTNNFERSPLRQCKIGGDWKHYCISLGLCEGMVIKIGAPSLEYNEVFFITLKYYGLD
jgi:hypothetical protein